MGAFLFDLDRTLVDVQTFTDYAAALTAVEALIGDWDDPPVPPTGWDGPTRRAMGVLIALTGDRRWQGVSDLIEEFEAAAVARAQPMPGLEMALSATVGRRRAVVTLLPEGAARAVLDRFGIGIEVLIPRRSDLAPKPAADQLDEAMAVLGVGPGDTTMFGDSTWDAHAAQAAGCDFIGITNGRQSEFASAARVASDLASAVAML